eukprot:1966860-Alexandrium_andersonii.AAC.1
MGSAERARHLLIPARRCRLAGVALQAPPRAAEAGPAPRLLCRRARWPGHGASDCVARGPGAEARSRSPRTQICGAFTGRALRARMAS